MANILDYLIWRGDLTLAERPVNYVDNLVLCSLSYIGFDGAADWASGEGCTLAEAARWLDSLPPEQQHIRSPLDRELLHLAAASARFGGIRLLRHGGKFSPEQELQFSATTFLLTEDLAYVAYRGTDSTLVGWKEDFNMAFLPQVPAQLEAVRYLNDLDHLSQASLLIGGHSKGGNLAVFAAAECERELQDRIRAVFSNDGPGFDRAFLDGENYRRILDRVHLLIPQSSIIGRLLEHEGDCRVIHSDDSGLGQHDPYTWQVLGAEFQWEDDVDATSLVVDQSIKSWLDSMAPEEREAFINQVYTAMQATNVKTLREFSEDKVKNYASLLRTWRELPQDSRHFMTASTKKLLGAIRSTLSGQLKVTGGEKMAMLEEKLRRMEDLIRREESENPPEE